MLQSDGTELAKKSFMWGVVSLFLYFLIAPQIIAIRSGIKARRLSKAASGRASPAATAGIALGAITFCLAALTAVVIVNAIVTNQETERQRVALVTTQLKECAQALDAFHAQNGKYPSAFKELKSSIAPWDMWDQRLVYAANESGYMIGTHGKSLDDPNDDFYWSSSLGEIVHGPLPTSLNR